MENLTPTMQFTSRYEKEEFTFFINSWTMLLDGGTEDLKFIALGICDFYVLWSSSVIIYLVSAPGK